MDLRKAAEQAATDLEELIHWHGVRDSNDKLMPAHNQTPEIKSAIESLEALRQALAQRERSERLKQKPVAWEYFYTPDSPFYTAPPKRKRVGLTHEERDEIDQTCRSQTKGEEHMTDLRQALAQPEPYDQTALELCEKCGWKAIVPDEGCLVCARRKKEPVAWRDVAGKTTKYYDYNEEGRGEPLYTAPPKREWVGMTDEDLASCLPGAARIPPGWRQTAQAIEAKLKEKNA